MPMQQPRPFAPPRPGALGSSGTFAPPALSPSIDERVFGAIETNDRPRVAAADCMRQAREAAEAGQAAVRAIHANSATPVGDRHRAANEAAFKATEMARPHLDKAFHVIEKNIAIFQAKVDAGPVVDDTSQHAEIRQRLASMSPSDRRNALRRSLSAGDDSLTAAALAGPAILSGLDQAELDLLRVQWASMRIPETVDRIRQLSGDLGHVVRAGNLLGHWQKSCSSPEFLSPPAGLTPLNRNSTLAERAANTTAIISRMGR